MFYPLHWGRIACAVLCLTGPRTCLAEEEAARWQQLEQALVGVPPIHSAQASFVQEKTSPLLLKPMTSRGTARLADGVIRFDTREPYTTVMHLADGRLTLYDPASQSAERITLDASMAGLTAGLSFEAPTLRRSWLLVSLQIDPLTIALSLQPREAHDPSALPMRVVLDRTHAFAREITLSTGVDESTRLTFNDVQINPPLTAEDLFLQLPEDVKITEIDTDGATP